jgi:endonuclease/exonuclease/phosphatase family metal-dependent hydrolase
MGLLTTYGQMLSDWTSQWGLIELDLCNKQYTWTNNQENLVLPRIDRVFVSTEWERAFPLARVKALNRLPSDHNPLLIDLGCTLSFGKKRFMYGYSV